MARKLALIIGNSQYQDTKLAQLVTPGEDANDLAEVLRAPEISGFDEVTTLVNESSTRIRLEVESFFAEKKPDDLMLLYFSGHGVRDDQGYLYLAVNDTRHNRLRATAIPGTFITDEMDRSRSRRQVLILDCCHSGAFAQGTKGTAGVSVGTASAFEGTGYGRVVLTASDSTQYAWEGDEVVGEAENSVFTHYLVEGLRTGAADLDADGRITLDELYDYTYEQVVTHTPKQTPGKWSYKQLGEIVIARNPRPITPKPAALPAELQQTLEDPRPWVREGAVRELSRLLHGSHTGLALSAGEALKRLTNDDSRRVSVAAQEVWSAYEAAQAQATAQTAATAQALEDRLAQERIKAERLAAQREEEERRARELARQAGAQAAAPQVAERQEAAQEVSTPLAAEASVMDEESVRTGRLVNVQRRMEAAGREKSLVERIPGLAAWAGKSWFPLAVLSAGWGAALFSSIFIYWILELNGQAASGLAYWLVLGFLGGTATWFALRASTSNEREVPPVLIIGLWVVSTQFGSWLYPFLESNIGIDESVAVSVAVFGAVGGTGTSAVLYWRRIVNRRSTVIIAGGWAIAWLVGAWLALSLLNQFGGDVPFGIKESLTNLGLSHDIAYMLMPWVDALIRGLTGALAGLVGGRVMLGQLRPKDNGR